MPKDDLLAVAFTDLNGNDKFNPNKDVLIAALVDTNNDNVPSVGDKIVWGTYPAIPDGSASGTGGIFTSLDDTVTNVLSADSTSVRVDTAGGEVTFVADPNRQEFGTITEEVLHDSNLIDSITLPGVSDTIVVLAGFDGPGLPNTSLDTSVSQLGDQGFLDVLLFF